MVDLGVFPSPLALSAFRIDSKFDLPAVISKLRYTTTKLRPRDGPTLQWCNEFADLLAMNALTDYIYLPPPSRQSSYATYPDANDVEAAYTASMRGAWTSAARADFITQHFTAGDLRDGKGYYDWAMSFKATADPTAQ
eukprot:6775227-Prymnesium_polylepis.1